MSTEREAFEKWVTSEWAQRHFAIGVLDLSKDECGEYLRPSAQRALNIWQAATQAALAREKAAPVSVPDGLIDALRHQRQVDADGTECGVSRQAVDEAIEILERITYPTAPAEAESGDGSRSR